MRYIVVPESQSLVVGGKEVRYGIDQLNAEFVLTKPVWRESAANLELLSEVLEKFAGRQPGDVVALTDEAFEIYSRLATLRGVEIQNPAVVVELTALMRPILRATNEPPGSPPRKP